MPVNKSTQFGKINIASKAIASIVADAALECYGVVGLASRGSFLDKILTTDEFSKGVVISQSHNNVSISLYLVISCDVKITEVLCEVQKKVRYIVSKTFDIHVEKVDVFAVSLRKVN